MYREEYTEKMNSLLEDNTYQKQNKDPTLRLQKRNNDLVQRLEDEEIITKKEKYRLHSTSFTCPRMYGLPKIHKINIPMRPIVSSINAPHVGISRMLADILTNLVDKEKYNVQNSYKLIEQLRKIKVPKQHCLVSFDAVSLFTNISLDLVYKIINEKWNLLKQYTKIEYDLFMDLMDFCLKESNYFVFQQQIFTQLDGVPMGSPLAPVLANLTLDYLLEKVVPKLKKEPKVLVKYVDDLLLMIHEEYIQDTLEKFNGFHPKLVFTKEDEIEGKLSYLDIEIERTMENVLSFNWYQKAHASERILNYSSNHPNSHKRNVAKNLIKRVITLSDEKYHQDNIKKATGILRNNNYPYSDINKWIGEVKQELKQKQEEEEKMEMERKRYRRRSSYGTRGRKKKEKEKEKEKEEERFKWYFGLSYIEGLSENIRKIITPYNKDAEIAHKITNSARPIYNQMKDKIKKEQKNNVIYRIPCAGKNSQERCDKSYVGETGRSLGIRLKEHASNQVSLKGGTALVDHVKIGHKFDFEKTEILNKEPHYRKRLLLESFHICTENTVNFRTDTQNVNQIYFPVLEQFKNKVNSR